MPSYRLNIIHQYNNGMNDFDIADQVQNFYQQDLFMQTRKWQSSIMIWFLQILQANAYILYTKCMVMQGFHVIYYFDFNKKICLAWIDPVSYWPKNKRLYQAVSDGSVSIHCTRLSHRDRRFTDQSMCPISDSLRTHVQTSEPYWPVPQGKTCVCFQLHR